MRRTESSFKGKLPQRSSAYPPLERRASSLCPPPTGPLYDTIYDSILASNCPIVAKYYKYIIAKENELFQSDMKLKKRIRQSQCLLMAAVENMKSAEETYNETGNKELTLKLYLQTVHMIEAQDEAFNWLVKELFKIILNLAKDWEEECMEMLARTRYEYGLLLSEMGDDNLNEAIEQMTRSFQECKGTLWYTNDKDRNILQEDCCVKLCQLLLLQAQSIMKTEPKKAAELAHQGVLIFLEVGIGVDKNLYCIANLREAEYLTANMDYKGAFQVLSTVQNTIMPGESPRNKCEFYLLLGVCYFFLLQSSLALRKLKLSLCLSENYDFPDLKAKALLYCGKIHAKDSNAQALARDCFMQAKDLFKSLKDVENEKLAKYFVAKLKTYQIFPAYIELMKQASYAGFCYFFDLLKWKQKMLPFWNDDLTLRVQEDELQCLLREDIGKELLTKDD